MAQVYAGAIFFSSPAVLNEKNKKKILIDVLLRSVVFMKAHDTLSKAASFCPL